MTVRMIMLMGALSAAATGCGASMTPAQRIAGYDAALRQVAADVSVVEVEVGGLAMSPPTSTLLDVASAADDAHRDLTAARVQFTGDADLFQAATDLTAAMGTLGDAAGSPDDASIAARFLGQFRVAATEWDQAVNRLAASAGRKADSYRISVA